MTTSPSDSASVGTLVVGYDGRDESERALTYAIDEATSNGDRLVVVVVGAMRYEPIDPYLPGSMGMGYIEPIPEGGPLEIQPLLERARDRLAEAGVAGEVEWAVGDPVQEIVRVVGERGARALVVGTHHHSALGRLFGTDIASELTKQAGCDVLIAR